MNSPNCAVSSKQFQYYASKQLAYALKKQSETIQSTFNMAKSKAVPQEAENITRSVARTKSKSSFGTLSEKNISDTSTEKTALHNDSLVGGNPSKGSSLTMWLQFYQSY